MSNTEDKVVTFINPNEGDKRVYVVEGDLYDDLKEVLVKYDGRISTVACIGVLQLLAHLEMSD